jgi:hypothetical protein
MRGRDSQQFRQPETTNQITNKEQPVMETVATLAVAVGIGYWAYKAGKRDGSKAAFKVGWRRGRQSLTRR